MKDINDLYNELKKQYIVDWNDKEKSNSFNLYLINKQKRYRLYVSEDLVSISRIRKIKIFKFHVEYEENVIHAHFDNDYSTINDIYNQILKYIGTYSK